MLSKIKILYLHSKEIIFVTPKYIWIYDDEMGRRNDAQVNVNLEAK